MIEGDLINWIVSINIMFSPKNIHLTQTAYLKKMLKHFRMKECRPVNTLLENQNLITDSGKAIETTKFQAIIGCLMYAAVGTRPDIAYAVTFLAQSVSHLKPDHWIVAK